MVLYDVIVGRNIMGQSTGEECFNKSLHLILRGCWYLCLVWICVCRSIWLKNKSHSLSFSFWPAVKSSGQNSTACSGQKDARGDAHCKKIHLGIVVTWPSSAVNTSPCSPGPKKPCEVSNTLFFNSTWQSGDTVSSKALAFSIHASETADQGNAQLLLTAACHGQNDAGA